MLTLVLLNKLIWYILFFLLYNQFIHSISINTGDSEAASKTVKNLISWLLMKSADLDLHCFLKRICLGSAGQGLQSSLLISPHIFAVRVNTFRSAIIVGSNNEFKYQKLCKYTSSSQEICKMLMIFGIPVYNSGWSGLGCMLSFMSRNCREKI